jgi:Protein of unknown function (DUF2939)
VRWTPLVVVATCLAVLAWLAWPYYSLLELYEAVRDGDRIELDQRVDCPSVRAGFRDDLNAFVLTKTTAASGQDNIGAGIAALFGPTLVYRIVDSYVTPSGLAAILSRRSDPATPVAPSAGQTPASSHLGLRGVSYAFFSGPTTFRADIDSGPGVGVTTMIFRWNGGWQLARIYLPIDNLPTFIKQSTRQNFTATCEPECEKRGAAAAACTQYCGCMFEGVYGTDLVDMTSVETLTDDQKHRLSNVQNSCLGTLGGVSTQDKTDLDQIAALLDNHKLDAMAAESKPLIEQPSTGGLPSPTIPGARLSADELGALRDKLAQCWSPPKGWTEPVQVRVVLMLELNRDRTVNGVPNILEAPQGQFSESAPESALRAVRKCAPYALPTEKYDGWKQVKVTFDPQSMGAPGGH